MNANRLTAGSAVFFLFVFFLSLSGLRAEESKPPYNFVVFKTDDQRWDTLWAMPILKEKLMKEGVTFTNAFVSAPICCPERASFLSGGFYAKNTGVLTNELPNGTVERFEEPETLPVLLQRRGYQTALIGKYMHGYPLQAPAIPPGWTQFIHRITQNWYVKGGSGPDRPSKGEIREVDQYPMDYLRDSAVDFIRAADDQPFFLYLTPNIPHPPARPQEQDKNLFSDYQYRGRAYGEEDLKDKPAYLREKSKSYNSEKEDEFHRNQLRSLQSVDRAVGELVDELKRLKIWERTVFIFMSDNGYLWGEHGLSRKLLPYEESIRVPLIIAMPGTAAREDAHTVVANLDVPALILELAGISRPSDGLSLAPLLKDPASKFRPGNFLLEGFHRKISKGWTGLRGPRYKYIEHTSGEKELYDLEADPYEMENQSDNPAYAETAAALTKELQPLKGLTLIGKREQLPQGVRGKPFSFQNQAWGGKLPYRWQIVQGKLPQGLQLDPVTGEFRGTPEKIEAQRFMLQVQDASVSPYHGKPQTFLKEHVLEIRERRSS
jgi:N-acetylglucosamine-6-sulfatase